MTHFRSFVLTAIIASLLPLSAAMAQEADESPGMQFSLSTGAMLTRALPTGEALPGYAFVGASVLVPVHGRFSLIPGLGLEVAPNAGNWGVYGSVFADFIVTDWLAVDFGLFLTHDQDPMLKAERGNGMTAYVGFGPAVTFILPSGLTIGPSCFFMASVEGFGWAAAPGASIGIPFPSKQK